MVLFGAGPLLILALRRPGILFLALWLGGVVTYRVSRARVVAPPPDPRTILRRLAIIAPFRIGLVLLAVTSESTPRHIEQRRQMRRIFGRFLILGLLIAILTRYAMPAEFFDLPRQRPALWVAIMILYPVLSVWPQEVIFRRFLFQRYETLFGAGTIAASAIAFGFAHIIFLNGIAVAMTTIGGAMFAFDYARHRSLWLACVEHSLYGCLIFTIGLGRFFYTGAAWHH